MRRLAGLVLMLVSAWAGAGCMVVTLQPFYTPETILFDDLLLGTWRNKEDNASLIVKRGEWKSYQIVYQDATVKEELTGYLTAVGNRRFADLSIQRGRDFGPFLVPVHAIFAVDLENDTLSLTALNYDWFEASRETAPLRPLVPALDERMNVVLAAPTVALRSWVGMHVKTEAAFSTPAMFERDTEGKK